MTITSSGPTVLSRCGANLGRHPGENVPCAGELLSTGALAGGCGNAACAFATMRPGAGYPPFVWKRQLYVGAAPVPGTVPEDET